LEKGAASQQHCCRSIFTVTAIVSTGKPKQGTTTNPMSETAKKRPSAEIARVIRQHLKAGKTRSDIMEEENLTPAQYRWGLLVLGRFPKRNVEAFATFLADETVRLEQIADDMQLARSVGDLRALAAFHKIISEIKVGSMELAMKLGLLQRAADRIQLDQTPVYEVSFGDEDGNRVKPVFPPMPH
jgi:hypothetical protein